MSRDTIEALRGPTPGAPLYLYDDAPLPRRLGDIARPSNIEALEDAGLLSRHAVQSEIATSQTGGAEEDEGASIIE